jgi:hypothetical protein
MRQMLVITPHHNIVRLTDMGNHRTIQITRLDELYEFHCAEAMRLCYAENCWMQNEGFMDLVIGNLELDFDPELEAICKTIELV